MNIFYFILCLTYIVLVLEHFCPELQRNKNQSIYFKVNLCRVVLSQQIVLLTQHRVFSTTTSCRTGFFYHLNFPS